MRWSIIRLIWVRELRDQLRDRRTVVMIVVLPLVLYPAMGMGLMTMLQGLVNQPSTVGVYYADDLPSPATGGEVPSSLPVVAWMAALPAPGGSHAWVTGAGLASGSRMALQYPPLVEFPPEGRPGRFLPRYFEPGEDSGALRVVDLGRPDLAELPHVLQEGPTASSAAFVEPLKKRQVDVLLIVRPHFHAQLERGEQAGILVLALDGDDHSAGVAGKVKTILDRYKKQLKEVRLLRRDLPTNYDEVFELHDPSQNKGAMKRALDNLIDLMGQIFPILLVMWSLAGALYPAVDLCAGEKERGTMETLLISPVSREEIVYGKFLAIWVFSAATALLNLLSMAVTAWKFGSDLPQAILSPGPLAWCVVLVLPLSAFFSALCLALGAYARSSKEGQYYLMPLFLVTMPLVFLTLMPGVKLSPFYSLVPVTGVALLLRELMMKPASSPTTLFYFLPVLGPMVLYGWLALRWAVLQFQREEVLFREAERLDVGLWLRRMFREKEARPSVGQGLFCVGLILLLRWLSFGFGGALPLMASTGIGYLAFVLAPPVFMAAMLTTRPWRGLGLSIPPLRALLLGVALALLLLLPLAELTTWVLEQFPNLLQLLKEGNPLTRELEGLPDRGQRVGFWVQYLVVLGLLAPLCEEVAFRGFLLGAFLRRFRPWAAILFTSFLFALFHANVFQFVPAFVVGAVLALLAVRTGSIWPGVVLHASFNCMLFVVAWIEQQEFARQVLPEGSIARMLVAALSTLAAGALLWRLWAAREPLAQPGDEVGAVGARAALTNGQALRGTDAESEAGRTKS